MRRLCIYILLLVCLGAVEEAVSAFMTPPIEDPATAGIPWRIALMIALPALGIYGRRRYGR